VCGACCGVGLTVALELLASSASPPVAGLACAALLAAMAQQWMAHYHGTERRSQLEHSAGQSAEMHNQSQLGFAVLHPQPTISVSGSGSIAAAHDLL